MLEATPTGLWRLQHRSGGQSIARLDVSWWKEAGEISIAGQPYRLYRESLLGAFVLELQGAAVARATKPSVFRSLFDLELAGRPRPFEAGLRLRENLFGLPG